MAVKIFSCLPLGLEGRLIEVEVDISQGMSAFNIVGLGDTAVQESKERIRSAIKNSGISYPQHRKTVNLAPANVKKHGPLFDLPMAMGIICAAGLLRPALFASTLVIGELALNGDVRAVNGTITIMLFALRNGWKKVIIPVDNLAEASLIQGVEIIPVHNLSEAVSAINGVRGDFYGEPEVQFKCIASAYQPDTDFSDIIGQEQALRAMVLTAAGGHHLLLSGPPGVGKTMLARALPGILPPLSTEEKMEVLQIYSCAGLLHELQSFSQRPFRAVHPSCTLLSLIGGGTFPRPGEITLAHNGVLFMDEIAEFSRAHLEVLRQPLEDQKIHLSRVSSGVTYPTNFTLVAGMNPCPCGYFGDEKIECKCRPFQIINYQKKMSGPIMDRIDLFVELERQKVNYFSAGGGSTSKQLLQQVIQVREIQSRRFGSDTRLNSQMTSAEIKKHCPLTSSGEEIMNQAMEKLNLSGRSFHKVLKVARTIADLDGSTQINETHLAEALKYRRRA